MQRLMNTVLSFKISTEGFRLMWGDAEACGATVTGFEVDSGANMAYKIRIMS